MVSLPWYAEIGVYTIESTIEVKLEATVYIDNTFSASRKIFRVYTNSAECLVICYGIKKISYGQENSTFIRSTSSTSIASKSCNCTPVASQTSFPFKYGDDERTTSSGASSTGSTNMRKLAVSPLRLIWSLSVAVTEISIFTEP